MPNYNKLMSGSKSKAPKKGSSKTKASGKKTSRKKKY